MRLIDADALSSTMYHEAFETDSEMARWDSGLWVRYKMVENVIDNAPTIDPVKHGHWAKVCNDINDWRLKRLVCSVCHHNLIWEVGEYRYNYCPHCGAKMTDEEETE